MKYFDTSSKTHEIMKIIMDNKVVGNLNLDSKRGEKQVFIQINLYNLLISNLKNFHFSFSY